MGDDTYFFCDRWGQRVSRLLCMRRYRKGLKKCEGCETGNSLLVAGYQKTGQLAETRGQMKADN